MSEAEVERSRERAYMVMVPVPIDIVPFEFAVEPVAWVVLGEVQASTRAQAKDKAMEKWPNQCVPDPGDPVEMKLVPDRYWVTAEGTAEAQPAPLPKVTWKGL